MEIALITPRMFTWGNHSYNDVPGSISIWYSDQAEQKSFTCSNKQPMVVHCIWTWHLASSGIYVRSIAWYQDFFDIHQNHVIHLREMLGIKNLIIRWKLHPILLYQFWSSELYYDCDSNVQTNTSARLIWQKCQSWFHLTEICGLFAVILGEVWVGLEVEGGVCCQLSDKVSQWDN